MESLLNWTNALLCLAGAYACACRLANMEDAKTPILLHYVMWAVVLVASATSPLQGYDVSLFQLILGTGVVVQLALGYGAWRGGAPQYTRATQ